MIFDCAEQLRRAIKIRAARTGVAASDLITSILEAALPKEIQEAAESIAAEGDAPSGESKAKRGRKPKA